MKKICVVVGSRANYSSIKTVLRAIQNHAGLELLLVLGASAVLDRYGKVADLVEADGFEPAALLHILVEGETPATMAKSTGLGLIELPTVFERLKPDIVLTVGDRFETMATTLAAAYMNLPIAHTMGGEVSGSIDESIRHAITKFAHVHFPATEGARTRIVRLGEDPSNVHLVGCPRIDLVREVLEDGLAPVVEFDGVGDPVDLNRPFVLVSQHPVTSEYGQGEEQVEKTLRSVSKLDLPAIVLWPNADAGSEDVARGIRKWRENDRAGGWHFFKNLPTETYISLMDRAACLVGNSSSGIREGAFVGTPVVNIGSRQHGRERGANVMDVGFDENEIMQAIQVQIEHGPYPQSGIYGDGRAGLRIAEALAAADSIATQKRITY